MARAVRKRSSSVSVGEELRLKDEVVRLIRDGGHTVASVQRALHLPSGWVSYRAKRDPAFSESVRLAKLEVTPASSWQSQFVRSRRRGRTRVEALDEVRQAHPTLTAGVVESEIAESAAFRAELEDLAIRERWEIEDNLTKRAKKGASDARLVLSRGGSGKVLPGSPDASPSAGDASGTPGSGWISPEIESEEAALLEGKPYGKRRLTDGDALRRLSGPRPSGEVPN